MKWNYTLKSGVALRDAIDSGDTKAVLANLRRCYRELTKSGFIDAYDFERYTEDLELIDETDYVDVDYELDNLYDLCDSLRVWVAL